MNGIKILQYSVFSFLFFGLEPTIRKDIWMRTTLATVMLIFRECHSESYLVAAIFIVCFRQLRVTLTVAFQKKPNSWIFCEHESTYFLILSWAIIMKWISRKVSEKLYKDPSLHFKEHFSNIEGDISLVLSASSSVQQT